VTPSSFQKAVAAATRPVSRSATALKPIVIVLTLAGLAPLPRTTESSTATSDGSPLTPTVWPCSCAGSWNFGAAITAANGRSTIGRIPAIDCPRSRAIARSWMSRIAKSARPVSNSRIASVDADGTITCRSIPSERSYPRSIAV
jgi:hypothetical protein